MNVLLDECLPRKLKAALKPHSVLTVVDKKWAGKKNGELLALAAEHFDVFITADQNLQYQQNLLKSKIPILALSIPNNHFETVQKLCPKILSVLSSGSLSGLTRIS